MTTAALPRPVLLLHRSPSRARFLSGLALVAAGVLLLVLRQKEMRAHDGRLEKRPSAAPRALR